ncbi:hypothetical protein INR49_016312, partial [Caranx melampygus]
MSLFLPKLTCKKDIDEVIKGVAEKVVVLRFGRDEDSVCLQLDEILSKTAHDLSNMASIYIVDVDKAPIYTRYFDISYIPSTVFFFNGQHMKVDYGLSCYTGAREAAVAVAVTQAAGVPAPVVTVGTEREEGGHVGLRSLGWRDQVAVR